MGTLSSIFKSGATTSYAYSADGLCHLLKETRTNGTVSFDYNYGYDPKGRVSTLAYPNGLALSYGYNDYDDLLEIKVGTKSVWKITDSDVDANGLLRSASYGNGKQIAYEYDTQDRPTRIFVPNIIDFNYKFNDKQQLDYRDEQYYKDGSWQGMREDFVYDAVNRLESATAKTMFGPATLPPLPAALSMEYKDPHMTVLPISRMWVPMPTIMRCMCMPYRHLLPPMAILMTLNGMKFGRIN